LAFGQLALGICAHRVQTRVFNPRLAQESAGSDTRKTCDSAASISRPAIHGDKPVLLQLIERGHSTLAPAGF
jgi:hypothetical protein